MNYVELGVMAVFMAAFALGTRATWRQVRRYRDASPRLVEPRAYLVLFAFVAVSVVITLAAGYFGFLTIRRLLGYEAIPGISIVSLVVVAVVVLIPVFLDKVVARIADGVES